ncbi:MAG TPA: pyruvoyl-dependent arginine decarboxylase [Bacteroidales bacterium]|nr:pyruvoyl-dependent arginine decarboxylase [Bacteroidales bacterium]
MKNKQLNTLLRPELAQAGGFQKNMVVGNRIPRDYFVTTGSGESDITVHAGSYHLALKSAGIEMANIMTYSSILPGIANELPGPAHITHGAVVESIMAVANGTKGELLNAGIIYGWLYDRYTNEKYGGLVCEHNRNYTDEEITFKLRVSLNELYTNGFEEQFSLSEIRLITQSCQPVKNYGTALVALCFSSYVYPILDYPAN